MEPEASSIGYFDPLGWREADGPKVALTEGLFLQKATHNLESQDFEKEQVCCQEKERTPHAV